MGEGAVRGDTVHQSLAQKPSLQGRSPENRPGHDDPQGAAPLAGARSVGFEIVPDSTLSSSRRGVARKQGNLDHGNIKLGKAGRKRHLGIRPTVRGSAMNPNDHPHGGGEGRQGIGMPSPKSPWGKPTLGKKTRHNKRTDKYIVRRRGKKRR